MIDLSIIIVNYNVKEFLINLLESIKPAVKNISSEIIVVDNNSDDNSISLVNKKFPSVITIENKENIGFGKANNQALEIAKGKYLLLINPDTIVKENTFSVMIDFMKKNLDVGLAGCKVLNPDGSLQLACRRSFPGPWVSFTKIAGLSKIFPNSRIFAKYNLTYLDENKNYEVDAISGSFMFLRKKVYDKVGGFDPDFFMYGEDLDLCYRVQKAGHKVFYLSETEIIHYKGESTKRSKIDETKIFYNAMHLFVKKHFSSSVFTEAILQLGIILRKILAFANVNKFVLIGIFFDFILFYLFIHFSEEIYINEKWIGFPSIFKPYVYFFPAVFQVLISFFSNAYKKDNLSILKSIISLVIGMLLITSSTFFLKQFAFSRAVVLITYAFAIVGFSIWRIIFKYTFLKTSNTKEFITNTVVVGNDKKSLDLAHKLKNGISSSFKVIGLIGKELNEIGNKENGMEVIGSLENFRNTIKEFNITNVIFASESLEFEQMFSVISECKGENIKFLISGSELDFMVGKSNITHIENVPLLKVDYNILQSIHKIIKRTFDFVLSLIMIFTIFPFVYIFSKIFKYKNDFVKFVNQIPKILIGKKSFVGPHKKYQSDLYLGKLGATGFWFIEKTDLNDNIELKRLDLFYAKNQNIWLDLEILGKTIAEFLFKRS
ncbi:MAG: glycosyl transferase [Ignavibacteriae bacterium]|nr:MAG: glycosyl transferase [Ignavibacteriota bacterium]